ncbi:DUF550 domain-containing protein [Salmonella enterica]|nr:DUF550 domain-containing protein [Salmonella enterica]
MPLYRHAQPVPERERIRREHAEWSDATFGDVGPVGPLKHLSKEALEAAEQPGDLSEWADMQLLLWDAQRRAGITDEQITRAMIEKLAVNKQREWPEPKDGEPRLHVKEQPMLVATGATYSRFEDFWSSCKHPFAQDDELKDISWVIWNACRAAMLQSKYRDLSQPVDPQISEYEKIMLQAGNHTEQHLDMVDHSGDANEKGNSHAAMLKVNKNASTELPNDANLSTNSPVIPDGWISCSERMPEMGERQCYVLAADFKNNYPPNTPNTQVGVYGDWFNDGNPTWDDGDGEDLYLKEVTHWMQLPEPPQEVK